MECVEGENSDPHDAARQDGAAISPARSWRAKLLDAGRLRLKLGACLLAGAVIWLPCLHLFFKPAPGEYASKGGAGPLASKLAARHLHLWTDHESRQSEVRQMRGPNAAWDFMGRTYLVLSLANMGLVDAAVRDRCLRVMDVIIDETLRLESEKGHLYFMMDYGRRGEFLGPTTRSIFVDGEIALMLAARRLVEEHEPFRPLLRERVRMMLEQMRGGPVLCGESYPDECWMFCNCVALAAIRMSDVLEGEDHGEFFREWLAMAREKLVDRPSGLLVSSFSLEGKAIDGPEGSTIWMVAHMLQLIDPAFAEEQYRTARAALGRRLLGFGWSREWPETWVGDEDIDAGAVIPYLNISAGGSGMAIMGAAAFGDDAYLASLLTSLNFGGFPEERDGRLRYSASNQVGDAVALYALTQGALWSKVKAGAGGVK